MSYEAVNFAKENRVAMLQLSRPSKLDALNEQLLQELSDIIDDLSKDRDTKVIILYTLVQKRFSMEVIH